MKKEKKRKKNNILELAANNKQKKSHSVYLYFVRSATLKSPHTFPYRNQSSELRNKTITITINNEFFLKKKQFKRNNEK